MCLLYFLSQVIIAVCSMIQGHLANKSYELFREKLSSPDAIKAAFDEHDADKSGELDLDELKLVCVSLGSPLSDANLENMMRYANGFAFNTSTTVFVNFFFFVTCAERLIAIKMAP